jgi:hypothetical protein
MIWLFACMQRIVSQSYFVGLSQEATVRPASAALVFIIRNTVIGYVILVVVHLKLLLGDISTVVQDMNHC